MSASNPAPSHDDQATSDARSFEIFSGPLGGEQFVDAVPAQGWEQFWPALYEWLNGKTIPIDAADDMILTIRCDTETRWVAIALTEWGERHFIEFSLECRQEHPNASISRPPPRPPVADDVVYVAPSANDIQMVPGTVGSLARHMLEFYLHDEVYQYGTYLGDGRWHLVSLYYRTVEENGEFHLVPIHPKG